MMTTDKARITDADRTYVRDLFPELAEIADRSLADKVVEIWAETWKESPWERIEDAPKNPETVHARHKLVPHTRAVTVQGIAMAKAIRDFHDLPVNLDYVIAGCNLHDVSKLVEYGPQGDGAGKSEFGTLVQHAVYGVHKALAHGLPLELIHIIGSHTTQSRLAPKSTEAIIVYYADYADSDALMLEAGQRLLLMSGR
jgi:putative nucleotidyltransferase with HDIG domain